MSAAEVRDDRDWMLDAARGDIVSESALDYVRNVRALRHFWEADDPEMAQALDEGDAAHPGDRRRWGVVELDPPDTDPATTAAFVARTRPYRSTRLADVQPERVRWLASRRLPLGKLVTLDGDPDMGKSTLTLDLAARVTTGRPMFDDELALVPPSAVVLMAAEDGLADTIRPRLDAAGADVSLVHHLDKVPVYDDNGQVCTWAPPTLPEDLGSLEALIADTGAVLVVVDVLMAYLSGRADSHRDQDVRRALTPLAEMAERTGACIVLLRHIPKSQRRSGQAVAAGGGSIGIIGAARAGLVVAPDPDDDTGTRRVLARAKGNLAPPYPSWAYMLVSDEARGCARVEWLGETAVTGDQLLTPRPDEVDDDGDDAASVLAHILGDGPLWVKQAIDRMGEAGFSKDQAKRAKKKLKVQSEKFGKPGDTEQGWKWVLPSSEGSAQGSEGGGENTPPPSLPSLLPSPEAGPREGQTDEARP